MASSRRVRYKRTVYSRKGNGMLEAIAMSRRPGAAGMGGSSIVRVLRAGPAGGRLALRGRALAGGIRHLAAERRSTCMPSRLASRHGAGQRGRQRGEFRPDPGAAAVLTAPLPALVGVVAAGAAGRHAGGDRARPGRGPVRGWRASACWWFSSPWSRTWLRRSREEVPVAGFARTGTDLWLELLLRFAIAAARRRTSVRAW